MAKPSKDNKEDNTVPETPGEEQPTEEQMHLRAERLQRELDERNHQLEEYTALLKQLQADFDNFRKRTEADQKRASQYAREGMVEDLLPVMDSFEKAVQYCSDEGIEGTGIKGIHKQLDALMKKWGVTEIDASGGFDPNFHEALMVQEADSDNQVLEVFQKGYSMQGRVVRTAKVMVSKARTAGSPAGDEACGCPDGKKGRGEAIENQGKQ